MKEEVTTVMLDVDKTELCLNVSGMRHKMFLTVFNML